MGSTYRLPSGRYLHPPAPAGWTHVGGLAGAMGMRTCGDPFRSAPAAVSLAGCRDFGDYYCQIKSNKCINDILTPIIQWKLYVLSTWRTWAWTPNLDRRCRLIADHAEDARILRKVDVHDLLLLPKRVHFQRPCMAGRTSCYFAVAWYTWHLLPAPMIFSL